MITEALLVVIVSGVAALGGSAINGAVARAKTRSELEASPYTALATRVVALEAQVQDLTRCREEDRSYIVRLLAMWSVHMPLIEPPHPLPEWFRWSHIREATTEEPQS